MNFKKKIQEFSKLFFIKTGDWRGDTGQVFVKNNPAAVRVAELIEEESLELIEALRTGDEYAVRKETADLLYVTFAVPAIYDFPVEDDFMRVHENNLEKFTTGSLNTYTGKWLKHKDHPKPILRQLELNL